MRYSLLLPLIIGFFGSCTPEMVVERLSSNDKPEEEIITALIPHQDEALSPDLLSNSSNMILERGNYWTRGIPGFGENAHSAFAGEYSIPGKTETIKAWLTMEFMYYDDWTDRNTLSGAAVREKKWNEEQIIASALSDNWTLVLLLPTKAALSEEDRDRIVMNFINRLIGFSAVNQNISYPALIAY